MAKKWYNKSLKEMKYNPIGMWGAWVGAGLATIPATFIYLFIKAFEGAHGGSPFNIGHILIVSPIVIIGFLLGWGVHSIIRRLRT